MERTQETSERTYVFGKTEYKAKKAVWMPGEVGDGRVWIKTEVVEGDVLWIIGREWMEEWELVINVRCREREKEKGVRVREGEW